NIIKKYQDKPYFQKVNAERVPVESIIKMIDVGIADITLAYPVVSYPIKGMLKYMLGYIAAPKTPWGDKVIADLNKVIEQYRSSEKFLYFTFEWFDTKAIERVKSFIREAYQD
ncbi:hypothetical protein, partial [Zooshikella harenae]